MTEWYINKLAPRDRTANELKIILKDLYHAGYSTEYASWKIQARNVPIIIRLPLVEEVSRASQATLTGVIAQPRVWKLGLRVFSWFKFKLMYNLNVNESEVSQILP